MSVKREFNWDEKTKLLSVKTITEDKYSPEQIKNIIANSKMELERAVKALKELDDTKFALKKLGSEPRTNDLFEIFKTFFTLKIEKPSEENLEKTVKFWKENKERIEKDLKELEPYSKM